MTSVRWRCPNCGEVVTSRIPDDLPDDVRRIWFDDVVCEKCAASQPVTPQARVLRGCLRQIATILRWWKHE